MGVFLWLPFPEVNDLDANMQTWYQLEESNFFKRWRHKKRTLCRKNFVAPQGIKFFRNGKFRWSEKHQSEINMIYIFGGQK